MESVPQYFTDDVIFDGICSYLDIRDLLRLCQVNRYLKLVMEQKCKGIIKSHNLPIINGKTSIHQMRFYFDRCLTLYRKKDDIEQQKIQKNMKDKEKYKQQKYLSNKQQKTVNSNTNEKHISYQHVLTLQNPFKYKTITYFEVGSIYTVFLTIDKQAYIFKTCQIINIKDKKEQLNYQKRLNVAQIKCKSQNVTYLTQANQIYQIFGQKNNQKVIDKQELLQWSRFIQIQSIQASFNYTIFKPKKNHILYEQFLNHVYHYQIDLQKIHQNNHTNHYDESHSNKPTTFILLSNISFKYYLIQFDKQQIIIQYIVGNKQAYFLNQSYQCFVSYFQQQNLFPQNIIQNPNQNNKIIKAKIFHHLSQKPIIKIASGYNFFIALQRKIHDVSKWTVQQVCKWVRQIGFGQFAKIFNVQKVDGKKLLTIDKNYMYSSLGITKPNMQQKFIMLLQQVIQNKNKQDTIYGWGKNQNGQLGSRNANFIKQPQKIKQPNCFKQSEYIDSIFCGWFETFIRTQKGRIYRTLNYEKRRKNVQNTKQDQDIQIKGNKQIGLNMNKHINQSKKINIDYEQGYDSQTEYENKTNKNNRNYYSKKKRKYTQDQIKKDNNHKKFQEQQKWIQCEIGKAFFVQGYKDILFFIQCPSQKQFQPIKEKKLRTAKMVLNKIVWSLSSQQQELYKVGYIDKDMGLIQTSILQLKTFDFNENRIRYIKKSNHIVWDRQNKIDHVG